MRLCKLNGHVMYYVLHMIVLLCVWVVVISFTAVTTAVSVCKEPKNVAEIRENLFAQMHSAQLPYTLHNIHARGRYSWPRSQARRQTFAVRVHGEPTCKRGRKFSKSRREPHWVCPWHTVLESDPDRIPVAMEKARCNCNRCGYKVPKESRCQEIVSYVQVIRRFCHNGIFIYDLDLEAVPVGCGCRVQRSLKRHALYSFE